MRKAKKLCPKCHLEGCGPFSRYVLNARKKRYEPYYYFAHKHNGKISWCYIPRKELSNTTETKHKCVECACLGEDNFCVWQQAYIKKELLDVGFECEGYTPKPLKVI
jgi:hypothetical protein